MWTIEICPIATNCCVSVCHQFERNVLEVVYKAVLYFTTYKPYAMSNCVDVMNISILTLMDPLYRKEVQQFSYLCALDANLRRMKKRGFDLKLCKTYLPVYNLNLPL